MGLCAQRTVVQYITPRGAAHISGYSGLHVEELVIETCLVKNVTSCSGCTIWLQAVAFDLMCTVDQSVQL